MSGLRIILEMSDSDVDDSDGEIGEQGLDMQFMERKGT